jgi:hypothetical protein
LLDQVRDAIGDDARLARAGAGEDEQRPLGCEHGFALAFVEAGEEWHSLGRIAQARILSDRMRLSNFAAFALRARGTNSATIGRFHRGFAATCNK